MNRFSKFSKQALCMLFAGSMVFTSIPVNAASLGDDVQAVAETAGEAEPVSVSEDGTEYVYAVKDLEVVTRWSATDVVDENGNYVVTFPEQYNQIFYKIPSAIAPNRIVSATIDTDPTNFSIKLAANRDQFATAAIAYGKNTVTINTYGEGVKPSEVTVVGLMNLEKEELVKTIGNITFKLGDPKEDPTEEEKPVEEEKPSTNQPATSVDGSYNPADLTVAARWGTKDTVSEDGKYTVAFEKQYSQIFYKLPEGIDPTTIEKISVDTDAANFSVKFCKADDSHTELGVVYGNTTITAENIGSGKSLADCGEIGLMNLLDGPLTKTIGKITITCKAPLKTEYVYKLSELEIKDGHDYEVEGETFKSLKQYGEILCMIPEEVDLSRLARVIVNCSDSSQLSVKVFDGTTISSDTEKAVTYGNNSLDVSSVDTKKLVAIGIMGLAADFTTNIENVTFKMAEEQKPAPTPEKVIDGALVDCYKADGNLNPLITQRYCADPSVMVYNDTVYIYATNDIYEYDAKGNVKTENSYGKIKTLNCISSTDLVNWTDHGAIPVAGRGNDEGAAKWANNSWAPCAAHKTIDGKEKFFLYFADNGSGIGVLTSDSPTGPFVDPLGKQLISRQTPNCANVEWLFDPAVMVDDDGTGYLVFGGGVPSGKAAHPQTARVVKLGDDMISLDGDPVMIDAPYLFEDSGLNKVGDKYVYSYCSNFNCVAPFRSGVIQYMTSDNPMGPYEYQGELLENPGSVFANDGGNNHHSFFEFKDRYYITYHARQVAAAVFGGKADYRSAQIDEVKVSADGKLEFTKPSMKGVDATAYLNPYEKVDAETIYRNKGIQIAGLGDTYVTDVQAGDWIGVKGVDFSKGLSKITVVARAPQDTAIDVRVGSEKGTVIGTIPVAASEDFTEFSADFEGLSGTRNLYFRFKGELEMDSWKATAGALVDVEEAEDVEVDGIQYDIPDWEEAVRKALGNDFLAGGAVTGAEADDEKNMALITKHYNALTLGNELKPDAIFNYQNDKCPGTEVVDFNGQKLTVPVTDFSRAEKILDQIAKWNKTHPDDEIQIRGHVLTWHSQTPEWFFHEDYDATKPYVSKDVMSLRHEWYIKTVLTHFVGADSKYKDMFYGWDVVNEAVSDNTGTYRNGSENSSWWNVYNSNEFIINAFKFANKYAPADLELYYNDYNETGEQKSNGICQLLKDVKNAEGTRISGMGMQGHYGTGSGPSKEQFKIAARKYGKIVDKVQITELDFKCSSSYDGTANTADEENVKLAYRYKEIFDAVKELKAEGIGMSAIIVWGCVDKNSWLQTSNSVGGAANGNQKQMPLLFDDNYQAKPAYWAFVDDSKLTPSIQEISITEKVDDAFTAGASYSFAKGDTKVNFVPVWDATGLSVKVTVEDSTVDAKDAVTVYATVGNNKIKSTVLRSDATETENGYVAVVRVDANATLANSSTVGFDVVVSNGSLKAAFNDQTLSHEKTAEYFAKATLKPFMLIPYGKVVVGEDNSAVWDSIEAVDLGLVAGARATGKAKLAWDDENLYIKVDVVDSVLNADASAVHEKDSVEIFIDENNAKSAAYEDDDKQYRVNYLNEASFNGKKCLAENLTSKVTLTDNGYVLEAAIKWTDITPAAGTAIGFDVQINDADNSAKRIGTANWFDTTGNGWQAPSVFGTAVLAKPEEEVPEHVHTASEVVIENEVAATCTEDGSYDEVTYCTDEECGEELSRNTIVVPAKGHVTETKTTKATVKKDGSIDAVCTVCGETVNSTPIKRIGSIVLEEYHFVYDKKAHQPKALVNDVYGKKLVEGTDYDVTYSSNGVNKGAYTATIKFKGNYQGVDTKVYYVESPVVNVIAKKVTPVVEKVASTIRSIFGKIFG